MWIFFNVWFNVIIVEQFIDGFKANVNLTDSDKANLANMTATLKVSIDWARIDQDQIKKKSFTILVILSMERIPAFYSSLLPKLHWDDYFFG